MNGAGARTGPSVREALVSEGQHPPSRQSLGDRGAAAGVGQCPLELRLSNAFGKSFQSLEILK